MYFISKIVENILVDSKKKPNSKIFKNDEVINEFVSIEF